MAKVEQAIHKTLQKWSKTNNVEAKMERKKQFGEQPGTWNTPKGQPPFPPPPWDCILRQNTTTTRITTRYYNNPCRCCLCSINMLPLCLLVTSPTADTGASHCHKWILQSDIRNECTSPAEDENFIKKTKKKHQKITPSALPCAWKEPWRFEGSRAPCCEHHPIAPGLYNSSWITLLITRVGEGG